MEDGILKQVNRLNEKRMETLFIVLDLGWMNDACNRYTTKLTTYLSNILSSGTGNELYFFKTGVNL